jgi:transcriptional regulator with XRE-family HTH domain
VEEATGREFKTSVLGAYERGERVISVLRLQRLASVYRVPVDQLLPRPASPAQNLDGATSDFTPRRPVTLDLAALDAADAVEAQVIRRYINSIRNQRSIPDAGSMAIRAEDLSVIARFLERDETAMEMRLAELGLRS